MNNKITSLFIKRGSIFLAKFNNIEHNKFFVIIGEKEESCICFFFINSNIHPFIKKKPAFFNLQYPLKHSEYPDFLNYDSFIDCHALLYIHKEELIKQVQKNTAHYKGHLTEEDLSRIIEALRTSDLYSEREKTEIFK
jgi:hypothetical protein